VVFDDPRPVPHVNAGIVEAGLEFLLDGLIIGFCNSILLVLLGISELYRDPAAL
jgi:hypothetical protein